MFRKMDGRFRVNEYGLVAQRHIYPLYTSDGRGGYEFSSTMTFVKYKERSFCVFSAHAISPREESINNIGVLTINGDFMPLSSVSISYKICRNLDLVACQTIAPFEHKNYFDLDVLESTTEFVDGFSWIGFPKKKATQTIHSSKASSEQIQRSYLEDGVAGLKKWKNAEFLLLDVEFKSETENEIMGVYVNKNVQYKNEGFKQQGYSLRGMSGGAFFKGPKKINTDSPRLSDIYNFVGIGLEYIGDQLVKGASRRAVQELLEEVLGISE